jgi:hypothetical protein
MQRTLRALISLAGLLCVLALSASASSNARIVRLSVVDGSVQIDRATGQGFEKAFLNMPITQGVKLRTGGDGRAEVEFEDGSTARLTPNTTLQFTDLGLRDSGAKVSTVDVGQGMAYFEVLGEKNDEFLVTFGHEKINLDHAAHFRVDVQNGNGEVAVFNGNVQVNGPKGEVKIAKKQTATFDLDTDKYELAKNIVPDAYDKWDKDQSEYNQRRTIASSYRSPYQYGWSDLAYYGSFFNVAGFGSCWRPYFASAAWDPFMDGAWVYYPGFGYTWVSAYPWGWMPYHYGSWMYAGGSGWCWAPTYNPVYAYSAVPVVGPRRPPRFNPPRPPVIHSAGVVPVGRGPTYTALTGGSHRIVVRGNDAGLGIPRTHNNLGKVNRTFATKGVATVSVPRTTTTVPVANVPAGNSAAMGGRAGTAAPRSTGIQHTSPARMGGAGGMSGASGRASSPGGPRMSSPPPASRGSSAPSSSSPPTHR